MSKDEIRKGIRKNEKLESIPHLQSTVSKAV